MKKQGLLGLAALLFCGVAASAQEGPKDKGDPKKTIAHLIKSLDKTNGNETRAQAAMSLADFGPLAEAAIPALMDALQTKDEDVRLNAAIALGKIGKTAVAPLRGNLGAKDDDTRFYAVWALAWIGSDAKDAAEDVVKLLGDKNEGVRRKAAFALGRIAPDPTLAVNALIKAFGDDSADVRAAASEGVSKIGKAAVKPLIEALKSKQVLIRHEAAQALGEIGADAKDAIPALHELFLSTTKEELPKPKPPIPSPYGFSGGFPGGFRGGFGGGYPGNQGPPPLANPYANALAKIGKASIAAFTSALKDKRPEIRTMAVEGLGRIGTDAVPVLVDALGEKNVDVRRMAAQVLNPLRVSDKMVVLGLAYGLKDSDDQVKINCLAALQALGTGAKLAAPALNEALSDIHHGVRQQAFQTLQNMGEDPRKGLKKALNAKDNRIRINTASIMLVNGVEVDLALPILVEGLKENEVDLRLQAAHALCQTGRERDRVMPILVQGLKSNTQAVQAQALQGLSMLGNQAEEAVPAIIDLFKSHKEVNLRVQSLQVLAQHGAKGLPTILDALKDKEDGVRQQAVYVLNNVQGDLTKSIKQISPLLKDDNIQIRQAVQQLFYRMGREGVPFLIESLKDNDQNVQWTAIMHLRNLGAEGVKALPAMVELAKNKKIDPNLRNQLTYTMAGFGKEGVDALVKLFEETQESGLKANAIQALFNYNHRDKGVRLLVVGLKDKDAKVRLAMAQIVPQYGLDNNAKELFAVLKTLLKDPDQDVRVQTIHALSIMGPEAFPLLEEVLRSASDSNLRLAVLNGLHNYGYRGKTSIPQLIDCCKDKMPQVRWTAAVVLGNIGPDAKAAVPTLRTMLQDSDNNVRAQAQNALNRLGVKDQEK